jgi:molybdenum cofactor cytidylyltransferase
VAAILLAAGESRRWGADNKLLALVDGQPMIRRTAEALLKSAVRPILVVTGHEPQAIEAVLAGLTLTFHHAADYASGLSASLRTGIAATPPEADAILVCLGDMPFVRPETFDALAGAYRGQAAIFPAYKGQRGNPVLLGASLFPDLVKLTGDQGARALLQSIPERVAELAVDDRGTLRDIDRPEALRDC